MLTHRNLATNAMHFQAVWSFGPVTRWLVAAPLFHAAGSLAVLVTIYHAGQQVLLGAFDPAAALDLIAVHDVSATLLVPALLAAISDEQLARPRDLSSLRGLSHGGWPITTKTLRRAHAAFPDSELLHLYGATETAPIASALRHEERRLEDPTIRSCGQAVPGVEIMLAGPDGESVSIGEVGEVLVRGPNVMRGYWNKPEQTALALRDGWCATGDPGYLDARAHVYLVDQAKDMIVTGGENVYGSEVEEALYSHEAVLEPAVFDVLLPKSGAGKSLERELRPPHWVQHDAAIRGA